eukprot:6460686-Amphidinium_carterae.2
MNPFAFKAWNKSKGACCSPSDWLSRNRRFWELLLPIADVDEMLKDTSDEIDWDAHGSRIQRIVHSSWLGRSLFAFALPQILNKCVADAIAECVSTLAENSEISETTYLEARVDAKTKVRAIDDLATLPERREITLVYRGWHLKATVKSVEEQIELVFACHLRAWASRLSLLEVLPGEADLCATDGESMAVTSIADVLLHEARDSRRHLLKVLKTQEIHDGDKIEVQKGDKRPKIKPQSQQIIPNQDLND